MNVDLINVSESVIKRCALAVTGELNGVELSIPVSAVQLRHSSDEHFLMKDNNAPGGVVLEKINLQYLLPKVMDISMFDTVDKTTFQLEHNQSLDELQPMVDKFNDLREIPLLAINRNVLTRFTDISYEIARRFVLFCKVHGFWVLDFSDVILSQHENTLFITVVGTHPVYKGTVEVRV